LIGFIIQKPGNQNQRLLRKIKGLGYHIGNSHGVTWVKLLKLLDVVVEYFVNSSVFDMRVKLRSFYSKRRFDLEACLSSFHENAVTK
jgi:hypothetical protein